MPEAVSVAMAELAGAVARKACWLSRWEPGCR